MPARQKSKAKPKLSAAKPSPRFKPRRTPPAELARVLEIASGHQWQPVTAKPTIAKPAAQPELAMPAKSPEIAAPTFPDTTFQINFRASQAMARLLSDLSRREGSTRRVIAKLLRDAGHAVPEADINPVSGGRRRF